MVVYECEYTVDSRDIDPWYHCRPSGLMGMLQEAATQAACALHVSRDEMLERYNSFWMLARLWYRLDVPLSWVMPPPIRSPCLPVSESLYGGTRYTSAPGTGAGGEPPPTGTSTCL